MRYPRARSLAACCAPGRGLYGRIDAPQSDAANYPPARHRTPGDIISEQRVTSSESAACPCGTRATEKQGNGSYGRNQGYRWLFKLGAILNVTSLPKPSNASSARHV